MAIVLSPISNQQKDQQPLKWLVKCRETRTHCLCHFTLSFGRNYQCQNCPGPLGTSFGSAKARPVGRKEGNAIDLITNVGKPYANQRHFAKIFRRYDLSKPWADQRRFTGFRGRNYRGQNCPGPPGTLTEKYAPQATPLDPTTNIEEPYTSRRHFAKIFRQHDLGKPWTDQRRFTGFRGRNYRGQNCPGPPGTLTKKCTPLAIPMEVAREASSAEHTPTNTLRKPNQRWELVNQLSHQKDNSSISYVKSSGKDQRPLIWQAKCRGTRSHCLRHFTL